MHRYRILCIAAISFAILAAVVAKTSHAATNLTATTIKAALRTATPEEQGFVDRVVKLAQDGTLPNGLLESTFLWARKRPVEHRFQYFKQGLILRAAKLGIVVS
jgi:hypothetical protein